MGRKRHGAEQIIGKLREAEVEFPRVRRLPGRKKLGVTEQTYYRWRQGVRRPADRPGKRLKELEKENARLKQLVADQALDKAILKEAASGNF